MRTRIVNLERIVSLSNICWDVTWPVISSIFLFETLLRRVLNLT